MNRGGLAGESELVCTDGFEQGAVQRRSQRHHHRAAERLGRQLRTLQDGAVHAAQLAAPRREAASQHRVGHAELAERRDRVRCKAEPEAELTRRRSTFEDMGIPPGLPQGDGGRQAADAGADDQAVRITDRTARPARIPSARRVACAWVLPRFSALPKASARMAWSDPDIACTQTC